MTTKFNPGDRVAYLSSPTAPRSSAYCGTITKIEGKLATIANEGYGSGSVSAVRLDALVPVPASMTPAEVYSRGRQLWAAR